MKIGIFTPYLDSLGGGERYILTMAEYLSKKSHSVDIFWQDKAVKKKVLERLAIDLKRVSFVENFFYSKNNLLKKLNLSRQYDLLIFLSDGSLPFSLAKKNIIHFQRPFINVGGKSFFNQLKLKRFQRVIANSRFTKSFIDKEYAVSADVLFPPVDVEKFKSGKKRDLIISVGRFERFKKQKEMIKVFRQISPRLAGWEFCLIGGLLEGNKEYFEELKVIAQKASIRLLANISFDNLRKHYAEAKIYWHAAGFGEDEKTNPAAMEHFGITTVEAMASGCVPIVFDGGGQREVVNDPKNGFLWKTSKELTDSTLRLAENELLRKKMSKKAIEKSKEFSKEKFCQRIDQLINSIT